MCGRQATRAITAGFVVAMLSSFYTPAWFINVTQACERPQEVCCEGVEGWENVDGDEICNTIGSCPPAGEGKPCAGQGVPWECYDTEGNHLWIDCNNLDCKPSLKGYKYMFNGILVGECVYFGGTNDFLYQMDEDGVFLRLKHRTVDDCCCGCEPCFSPEENAYAWDDNVNEAKDWTVSRLEVGDNASTKIPREGWPCSMYLGITDGGWESGDNVYESAPDCCEADYKECPQYKALQK